ncbi:Wzz/FepE/Etk N-terminal domain-containing protein [Pseudomonas tohonis]|uniref:Wzz/FepE/Etk N-terminal domain-containing protein n=1 Tax=Pseudomonas tohonis TaxID=2725477 RepID=UPI001F213520|nr:Wzz/FepE/Etk N-terminal domain-containing protein [Pseudomonas tohonis]
MTQYQGIPVREDEVDLGDLILSLWVYRRLILGVMAFFALISAVYTISSTKYYKSESVLRPVAINVLDELNESGLYRLTPEEAMRRVAAGVASYKYRLEFFRDNRKLFESGAIKDGETLEQGLNSAIRNFEVLRPELKKDDDFSYVGLSYTYSEGVKGADIVNGLIEYVVLQERIAIAKDVEVLVQNRLAKLEKQMAAERAAYQANKRAKVASLSEKNELEKTLLKDKLAALRKQLRVARGDRIAQLNEAIEIAGVLGIEKPSTLSGLAEANEQQYSGNVVRAEISNQQTPLYFMGTEALKAERDVLQKRRSDDFADPRIAEIQSELGMLENNREVEILENRGDEDLFIEAYAKWTKEATELKGLNLSLSNLTLVNIDRQATHSGIPVSPQAFWIVGLATFLGLVIGLFAAFFFVVMDRR